MMRRSFATVLALVTVVAGSVTAIAQSSPSQCNDFLRLRNEADQKAKAIRAATERKAERKEVCTLVQRFTAAEELMVKFLVDNKTWCGVPDIAIKQAKEAHEKTVKFRTAACAEGLPAGPKPPSLSEAIGTPSIDSPKNTKTGRGTLDSLNGNPLDK